MPTLAPGTQLGPYRLENVVGRGGMGVVYKAIDTRLGRTVAVKVLPDELAGDADRQRRLQREARIVSSLSHPHICTIFDVGQEGDVWYLVMEYLDGETLDHRLAKGPLNSAEALTLAVDVGRALTLAHGRGIVHRDLKPGNLMLTDAGVKVLDFGLAKAWLASLWPIAGASGSDDTSLTREGTVLGTPPYMSPEQLRGDDVTASADIFALGAILFEMIAGRPAFTGPTPVAIAASVLGRERPSLAAVRPGVPAALDRAVSRCLALSPDARWPTMEALVEELERLARASPREAHVRTRRGPPWSPRWLGVAAAIVLVAGTAGLMRWHQPRRPAAVAILPFVNDTGDPTLDPLIEGITQTVIDVLSELPGLRVTSWSSVNQLRGDNRDPRLVMSSLGADWMATARVIAVNDTLVSNIDLISAESQTPLTSYSWTRGDDRTVGRDISRSIVDHLDVPLSSGAATRLAMRQSDSPEAYRSYLEGLSALGRRDLRNALRLFTHAVELDPDFARAAAGLSSTWALFGTLGWDLQPPSDVVPKARHWATEALRLDPGLAEAHAARASVLRFERERAEAEGEHLLSVDLSPSCATCRQWLASYYWTQNRFNEALSYLTAALALDGQSAVIRLNLGRHYYYQREYGLAIRHFREALDIDPTFWLSAQLIILSQVQLGDLPAAREEFERMEGAPPINKRVIEAYLLAAEGRRTQALEAIADLQGQVASGTYLPPYLFAPIYSALGDTDAGIAALEAAEQERSGYLEYLGLEPSLDGLRAHPMFPVLLERGRLRDFTPEEVVSVRPAA